LGDASIYLGHGALRIPKPDRSEADEFAWIGCDDAREVIVDPLAQSSASAPPRTSGPRGSPWLRTDTAMSMSSRSRSFASMSMISGSAGTRKPAAHSTAYVPPSRTLRGKALRPQQVIHEIETLKMRVNIDSRHVLTYALGGNAR